MALLGTLIDSRTIDTLTTGADTSFAHGLPSTPHAVIINCSTGAATSAHALNAVFNATNVTIQNSGRGTSPTAKVTTVVFHSIVQ